MKLRLPAAFLLRALALATFGAGCSSAVGNAVPSYGTPSSAPVQTASVTFTVIQGTASSPSFSHRRPAYLSTATRSVSIVPIVSGQPNQKTTIINIESGASGCSGSGATLSCSGSAVAPVGETSFTVTTYSGLNATGSVLSVGAITVDVKPPSTPASISNATSLTLDGIPASFSLVVTPKNLTLGEPSTTAAVVTAFDAGGAAIIGPGEYTTGIALETIVPSALGNDPVLHGPSSTTSVPDCTLPAIIPGVTVCHPITVSAGPSTAIELTYDGEFIPSTSITLAGESPGLVSQSVTIPVATPSPGAVTCTGSPVVVCPASIVFASSASTPVPMSVSEPGVTTFQASASSCNGIALVNNGTFSTGSSFTVEAGGVAGTCVIGFEDAALNQTVISVTNQSGTATPSPSPSPTPVSSPTPVPTGPINISPSNTLEFTGPTAPPQTFTASEAGVSSFTIDQSACAGTATVTPTAGTSFTVTPVATLTQGGSCTLSVVDPSNQTSPVKINVDGVSFVIN